MIAIAAAGCNKQDSKSSENKGDTPKKSSGNGWESDVGSLPKWTAKDSLLAELDEEVVFGGYAMRPPKRFQLSTHSDKFGPNAKLATYGWNKEELTPALWLDLMPRPAFEWDEGPTVRIKGDLGRVKTLCGSEAQIGAIEFGNVNGLVTARARFDATSKVDDKERKYKGYQIIARDGMTSLDVLVIVSDADDNKTLEILEASMLSLRKR
jgi:hypothetical protein